MLIVKGSAILDVVQDGKIVTGFEVRTGGLQRARPNGTDLRKLKSRATLLHDTCMLGTIPQISASWQQSELSPDQVFQRFAAYRAIGRPDSTVAR